MQFKLISQSDSGAALASFSPLAFLNLAGLLVARFVPESRGGHAAPQRPAARQRAPLARDTLAGLVRPRCDADAFDINRSLRAAVLAAGPLMAPGVRIRESYGVVPSPRCDGPRVQQAMFNLILDAAQALGGRGTVELSTSAGPGVVRLAIRGVSAGAGAGVGAGVGAGAVPGGRLGRLLGDATASACGGRVETTLDAAGCEVLQICLPVH